MVIRSNTVTQMHVATPTLATCSLKGQTRFVFPCWCTTWSFPTGVILERNTSSRHLYQASSKYSVGYSCYRAETRSQIQTQEGEITPKVKKPKLSFLYVTCRLVLFFITTKYYQNIPKSVQLTKQTLNQCIISVKYKKGR